MEREKLIRFIKLNDRFYIGADFTGHSEEQLQKMKQNIIRERKQKQN